MRIDRLKNQLAQCPAGIDVTDEIQHILDTAPQTLRHAENVVQTGNPALFEELNATLKRTEVSVTWATETIKGQATAQAIQEGREADPGLEVHQRLLNRIIKKVDGAYILANGQGVCRRRCGGRRHGLHGPHRRDRGLEITEPVNQAAVFENIKVP